MGYKKWFAKHILREKWLFIFMLIFLILFIATVSFTPLFIGNVFDLLEDGINSLTEILAPLLYIAAAGVVRTVGDKLEPGVSGTDAMFANVGLGEHVLDIYAKRAGTGVVSLYNWDFSMGQFVTTAGEPGRGNFTVIDTSFQSTNPTVVYSKNISKVNNASTYISASFRVSATGLTDVVCRLEDGGESPYFVVTVPNALSTRSVSTNYITEPENQEDELNLVCFDTNNEVVTIEGGFIEADMKDDLGNNIGHMSATNNNTNWSNTIILNPGDNEIISDNITIYNGTNILVSASSSSASLTGEQTPLHYLHVEHMNGTEVCYSEKERYTEGDIGNTFFYPVCEGLKNNTEYHISLHIVVEPGEQLELYDEAGSFFENTQFPIDIINTPPIVSIINPEDQQTIINLQPVNFTVTDSQNSSFVINVTATNGTYVDELLLNAPKGTTSVIWNTTNIEDGWWNLTVTAQENETIDLFSSNDTIIVFVDNIPPPVYCSSKPVQFDNPNLPQIKCRIE